MYFQRDSPRSYEVEILCLFSLNLIKVPRTQLLDEIFLLSNNFHFITIFSINFFQEKDFRTNKF